MLREMEFEVDNPALSQPGFNPIYFEFAG